ncbi:Lactate utilization protein C [Candidatus Calditenuaceae archaeon HR02]|nr:Lactate utilization protein C [Candidatus Calditenuaceae archaeon HR02]
MRINEKKVALFIERFRGQGGIVELVQSWDEALDLIERKARTVAGPVAVATCDRKRLDGIRKRLDGISRLVGPHASPTDIAGCSLGITFPAAGIAETGSILEICYDDSDRLVSTLPSNHIAYLESFNILEGLLEVAPLVRQASRQNNFSATIISGPSRTADIELRQVVGVHGPQAVTVLLKV